MWYVIFNNCFLIYITISFHSKLSWYNVWCCVKYCLISTSIRSWSPKSIVIKIPSHIGAFIGENLSSVVCEQHKRRPACASAQSDHPLCFSLFGKYHMLTCYEWNFNFLASLCSWVYWFETDFVGNPQDRFSRKETHIQDLRYIF